MRINTNMAALNAWRSMTTNNGNMQKSLERLSSGFRVNRAADDAAGLAVSEKMRSQMRGTNMAIRNAQDGISMVQTAEGGAQMIQDMVQRMRELAVQSASDGITNDDRAQLQKEFEELAKEINRTATNTKFNGQSLLAGTTTSKSVDSSSGLNAATIDTVGIATTSALSGTYLVEIEETAGDGSAYSMRLVGSDGVAVAGSEVTGLTAAALNNSVSLGTSGVTIDLASAAVANSSTKTVATFTVASSTTGGTTNIMVGPNKDDAIGFALDSLTGSTLGITTDNSYTTLALDTGVTIANRTDANNTIQTLDNSLKTITSARAKMGAFQNRLENSISTLQVQNENLTAAESRIRDVDMASEMAQFTKFQILSQASTAMLAQANQVPQGILSLLR